MGIALVATGCVNRAAQEQAKKTEEIVTNPKVSVSVGVVATRSVSETQEITGEVTTSADTQIGAKVGGRVVSVYVKDGDAVVAGGLIAELDGANQRIQVQQAMAQVQAAQSGLSQAMANAAVGPQRTSAAVAQAQAQLRSAKAQLQKALNGARPEERAQSQAAVNAAKSSMETAKKELDRVRTLFSQQVASQQRLEQAENAFNGAQSQYMQALEQQRLIQAGARTEDIASAREAVRQAEEGVRTAQASKKLDVLLFQQVESARANVMAAQSQLALARQSLSDLQIRAPFAGRISGRPVQSGSVVGVGTPVARLIGGDGAYFEGEIPASALPTVQPGSVVRVTVDGLAGQTFEGTVAATSPSASSIGRLFRARIQLAGAGSTIKPGMFARGLVTVRTIKDALVVPTSAITLRGDRSVVFVLNGSKVKLVSVVPGLQTDGVTQVTGDVHVGDQVVTEGQSNLDEGTEVEIGKAAADKKEGA